MRRPAQSATGGRVILGLVFKWFLLCEFSYLILLRVSSPEKAMAPHSSVLVWRSPGMEEPNRLPSMGSHRVRHN